MYIKWCLCFYDYQPDYVQLESKPFWEVAIERLANQIDSNLKKLANATSNRFDRAEERLDELASHFGTIQDQLYVLYEVIFF